jgi:NAD(P)-dependent dehydrogenase (short-subunit alcohol dehydrogenase family)
VTRGSPDPEGVCYAVRPEVVVVTGANAGIGFHLTKELLQRDYRVAALDISLNNLNSLTASHPQLLRPSLCDVSSQPQVERTIASVLQEWGKIDILINNAALALFRPFEEKPLEETRREFEVNYFGYLHTTCAVFPHMKTRRHGIIHNVSSGVGITGFPGIYAYASTKGAIEALSRTLRLEFSRYGIAVTLMHPPLTNTESAAPLGIPARAMADPAVVGRNLAREIHSTSPVVTPNMATSVGLLLSRIFPTTIGSFLARSTERARKGVAYQERAPDRLRE